MSEKIIHATTVALEINGLEGCVVLRGVAGSGKSDLALRLIETGARLVADDQTILRVNEGHLTAIAPAVIAGLLEVRGVGLLKIENFQHKGDVRLIIDLIDLKDVPRLPEWQAEEILGVRVPKISLYAFEPSAALKVKWALASVLDPKISDAS